MMPFHVETVTQEAGLSLQKHKCVSIGEEKNDRRVIYGRNHYLHHDMKADPFQIRQYPSIHARINLPHLVSGTAVSLKSIPGGLDTL